MHRLFAFFKKRRCNGHTISIGHATYDLINFHCNFYRAMLRRARLSFMPQYIVRPSVRPPVTYRYRDHIGWNSSKIISRPNSLRPLLGLTPTWAIMVRREHPQNWVEQGWGHSEAQKTCNISETVQDRTNVTITDRKSYTHFRLVPKSTTLDDLERRIQRLPKVFKYPLLSRERVKLYSLQNWPVHSHGPFEHLCHYAL